MSNAIARLSSKLSRFDWKMLKGTTLVSAALMVARILGLLYGLILTRALSQGDYGYVEYGLSVGGLMAFLTHPFGQHVLAFYIGRYVNDKATLHTYLNTAWLIQGTLFTLTLAVSIPLLAATGKLDIGVLIVYIGLTVFYTYYGLARGFLSNERLVLAFLGSNVIQLVATILLYFVLDVKDPLPALLIYGLSYLPMLLIMARFMPLQLGFKLIRPQRTIVIEILKFTAPVWLAHIFFVVFDALPLLYLEHFDTPESVGAYGLARRLSMVFMFVSQAFAAILLPRTAGMAGVAEQRKMLRNSALIYLASSTVPLLGWLLLYNPVAEIVSGPEYRLNTDVYVVLALATIATGLHYIYEAVLMGRGRSDMATYGRGGGTIAALIIGLWLVPAYGLSGAAITVFIGAILSQLLFMLFVAITNKTQPTDQSVEAVTPADIS